jgi:CheY-like chemotaxis protein
MTGDPLVPVLRVLVVDDCPDTTQTLAVLLEYWGYEVQVAHDGPAALTAAGTYQPDVVLLDIGLPRMDGWAVARQLRVQVGLERAFLIAMSGYAQERDRELSRQAGCDHHLVKPFNPLDLEQLLAERRRLCKSECS